FGSSFAALAFELLLRSGNRNVRPMSHKKTHKGRGALLTHHLVSSISSALITLASQKNQLTASSRASPRPSPCLSNREETLEHLRPMCAGMQAHQGASRRGEARFENRCEVGDGSRWAPGVLRESLTGPDD